MNAASQTKDFYGRIFFVTADVLIPRPETEQLIDQVLILAGKPYLPGVKPTKRVLPPKPIVLDVGTGSGCIAVTVKKELPEADVYAIDISEKALKIAQKNAESLDAPTTTVISYLLEKVKSGDLPTPDLIVANLPYVDKDWDWLDKKQLAKEPAIALYAEDHGLKLIKELIDQAAELKIPHLILEADPCQHEAIKQYAKKAGLHFKETRGFILYFSV